MNSSDFLHLYRLHLLIRSLISTRQQCQHRRRPRLQLNAIQIVNLFCNNLCGVVMGPKVHTYTLYISYNSHSH